MVIQCPECRTRFQFAAERIKPNGVKVRCARCMHIFLALPPSQEPLQAESQNAPSPLGFSEEDATGQESSTEEFTAEKERYEYEEASAEDVSEPEPAPSPELKETEENDFTEAVSSDAASDSFHLEFDLPLQEESPLAEPLQEGREIGLEDSLLVEGFEGDDAEEDPFGFGEDEPLLEGGGAEDDFSLNQSPAEPEDDFTFDNTGSGSAEDDFFFEQTSELDLNDNFDPEENEQEDDAEGFSFGFEDDDRKGIDPFAFDAHQPSASDGFELEGNAALDSSIDRGDDFDFTSDSHRSKSTEDLSGDDESDTLGFGRIDFSTSSKMEPVHSPLPTIAPAAPASSESHMDRQNVSKPAPPGIQAKKKRSSMGGLLTFVLLLLLGLVGLAGYVVWQGGPEEMVRILDRAGAQNAPVAAPGQIRLNDLRSHFVQNAETGQLFVISGHAINEFPSARSAVAIKGVLFSPTGEALLQQTVFAGNPVTEDELRRLSFAALEEKMNNQFGESLSNLNIAPGKAIPFTIVFKDLPENLAEFTVEITDSRPGSGE